MRALCLVVLLVGLPAGFGCGNYCGTYYCDGGLDLTGTCAFEREPSNLIGSCLDECCKAHDQCCDVADHSLRSHCNTDVVECLKKCELTDATCLYGFLPVMQPFLRLTMGVVEGWCCNAPCPAPK